jgi:2-polyprenyl-6-methoxyphenol hydroxylase-like FAD-dependent oxidoreductase
VRVQSRDGGPEERLPADLVVAASGRSGQLPAWLEELGCPRPGEDRLTIDLRYVSRRLHIDPEPLGGDRLIAIGARPGFPRGLFLIQQEDHWILTAFGYGRAHHPPTDDPGYLSFIESVAPADVIEVIRAAEPLTELFAHEIPANVRRRYERLKRLPQGLLPVGDAISSFNPLYGQGMSVAALEAVELRRCLQHGQHQLARRFLRAAAKVVDQAWDMAIGGDLALPDVSGDRPLPVRLTNGYVERLLQVAEHDPVVAKAFNDTADLIAPPYEVLRPRIVWRVLRGTRSPAGTPKRTAVLAKRAP